jgi:IS5 family transposase
MDIMNYSLCEKYEHLKKFGDRLSDMEDLIDRNVVNPLLSDLYKNDTEKGGRPNFDPVFMVKVMFLQSLYGLVDEAKEIELYANIRFMNFLDYPESMPDARTIWLFGEKIVDNHKDKEIWK